MIHYQEPCSHENNVSEKYLKMWENAMIECYVKKAECNMIHS